MWVKIKEKQNKQKTSLIIGHHVLNAANNSIQL